MPRRLRFAPPGYWLHLTQRGNNKQPVFSTDSDRQRFLDLAEQPRHRRRNLATAGVVRIKDNLPVINGLPPSKCGFSDSFAHFSQK